MYRGRRVKISLIKISMANTVQNIGFSIIYVDSWNAPRQRNAFFLDQS